MRFHEKDYDIPQVCLDLGFEDRSYRSEPSARMYNPQLGLALWVNGPNAADPEYPGRKRYVLIDCGDGTVGEAETDVELCALVASAHAPRFSPSR